MSDPITPDLPSSESTNRRRNATSDDRVDPVQFELVRTELARTELARTELARTEFARGECD
jgi:hypothetical protein